MLVFCTIRISKRQVSNVLHRHRYPRQTDMLLWGTKSFKEFISEIPTSLGKRRPSKKMEVNRFRTTRSQTTSDEIQQNHQQLVRNKINFQGTKIWEQPVTVGAWDREILEELSVLLKLSFQSSSTNIINY